MHSFILTCNILECNTCLFLDIYFGVALSNAHSAHHSTILSNSSIYKCKDYIYEYKWQYIC